MANDAGDRVTPAVVTFTDTEQVIISLTCCLRKPGTPPNNSHVVIDLDNSSGRVIEVDNSSGRLIDLSNSTY